MKITHNHVAEEHICDGCKDICFGFNEYTIALKGWIVATDFATKEQIGMDTIRLRLCDLCCEQLHTVFKTAQPTPHASY